MFDISEYLLFLLKKKKVILFNGVLAALLAFAYVNWGVEVQFSSSVTFFPPREEKSFLSLLPNASMMGGLTSSTDIMPQQINSIFYSKAIREKIIDSLGYYEKFELVGKPNPLGKALKILDANLLMDVEELGSLGMTTPVSYKLSFYHTDPDSAYNGVQYAYHLMDSTIRAISISIGEEKTKYVAGELEKATAKKDSLEKAFKEFQLENKAYDLPTQIASSLENYGILKSQLATVELEYDLMRKNVNSSHPLLKELAQKKRELNKRLRSLENKTDPSVMVGLENAVGLLPEFVELKKDLTFQNSMVMLLQQQYEEGRLKASKDLVTLRVIDPAYVAQYKARPKRAIIMIMFFALYQFALFAMLTVIYLYKAKLADSEKVKEFLCELKKW